MINPLKDAFQNITGISVEYVSAYFPIHDAYIKICGCSSFLHVRPSKACVGCQSLLYLPATQRVLSESVVMPSARSESALGKPEPGSTVILLPMEVTVQSQRAKVPPCCLRPKLPLAICQLQFTEREDRPEHELLGAHKHTKARTHTRTRHRPCLMKKNN